MMLFIDTYVCKIAKQILKGIAYNAEEHDSLQSQFERVRACWGAQFNYFRIDLPNVPNLNFGIFGNLIGSS